MQQCQQVLSVQPVRRCLLPAEPLTRRELRTNDAVWRTQAPSKNLGTRTAYFVPSKPTFLQYLGGELRDLVREVKTYGTGQRLALVAWFCFGWFFCWVASV
jgi:hypothetical protein